MSGLLSGSVEAGLLARFQAAGAEIQWRTPPAKRAARATGSVGGSARIAHLHDEEARVVTHPDGTLVVDSGPVGALVLLLEIDRRGAPTQLVARDGGVVEGFAQGAIEARWGAPAPGASPPLPLKDVVALARYALA